MNKILSLACLLAFAGCKHRENKVSFYGATAVDSNFDAQVTFKTTEKKNCVQITVKDLHHLFNFKFLVPKNDSKSFAFNQADSYCGVHGGYAVKGVVTQELSEYKLENHSGRCQQLFQMEWQTLKAEIFEISSGRTFFRTKLSSTPQKKILAGSEKCEALP